MVKDQLTVQLTRKFGYFYDTQHFKIITRTMTDNIIPEHTGHTIFLGIPYNF